MSLSPERLAAPGRSCKLVQISDLHLQSEPFAFRDERNHEQQLLQLLDHIQRHHPDADALLVSGDLVDHGGAESYQRLVEHLNQQALPWYWIPGNHDDAALMRRLRPQQPSLIQAGDWQLQLLDSSCEPDNLGSGALSQASIEQLQAQQQSPAPQLLLVHHPPLDIGCHWLDRIKMSNADAFWQALEGYPLSLLLLCGHIHQVVDLDHQSVRLLGCPSTALQFTDGSVEQHHETEPPRSLPGYRWLKLLPIAALDQQNLNKEAVKTAVVRVAVA
jgi:Icc protein